MIIDDVLERAAAGERLSAPEALALADSEDPRPLMRVAATLRDEGHGGLVSYSRKVFIPLTQLCRDVCHYCTFAHPPRPGEPAYLSSDQVLAIARAGARAGCHEALFTLGDKPELRYAAARDALERLGHDSTLSYLAEMAGLVLRETGLLPHLNPGLMTRWAAFRVAGQGSSSAPRDDPPRGRGGGAVHLRDPDRHRRNAT
jgi:FO synthase